MGIAVATEFVSLDYLDPTRNSLDEMFSLQNASGAIPYCGPTISCGFQRFVENGVQCDLRLMRSTQYHVPRMDSVRRVQLLALLGRCGMGATRVEQLHVGYTVFGEQD